MLLIKQIHWCIEKIILFYKFLKYTKICLIKWWYENSKYNQLKFSQLKIKFKTKKNLKFTAKVILTLEPWTCIRQNRQQTKKIQEKRKLLKLNENICKIETQNNILKL